MEFKANWNRPCHRFTTIDSHTEGEPTRIVLDGFPRLEGKTMMERKQFLERYYDHFRTALMLEPRGHRDMFGALITDPVHTEADLGVIFMDSGGYLNMCGHGSIGTATVAVELGLVKVTEPYTEVVLDAPAGLIRTRVKIEHGKAAEVSILNVPSFVYKENIPVEAEGFGTVPVDISFGGSFFALVDTSKIGLTVSNENLGKLRKLGMQLLKEINDKVEVSHPYLDIHTVDLVEFFGLADEKEASLKNVVIFGDAQVDRSPCGTGTSAKLAYLYSKGQISKGEEFVYESITGSLFRGTVVEETTAGDYRAIIPRITGKAYVTGINQWVLDEADPLKYGFLMGERPRQLSGEKEDQSMD